eukprot:349990-Chlamydomonas_euryale.AAC.16
MSYLRILSNSFARAMPTIWNMARSLARIYVRNTKVCRCKGLQLMCCSTHVVPTYRSPGRKSSESAQGQLCKVSTRSGGRRAAIATAVVAVTITAAMAASLVRSTRVHHVVGGCQPPPGFGCF